MPQLYTARVNVIFLIFVWLESCCGLVWGTPKWFQVLGQIVMHVFPVWNILYIHLFWTSLYKLYLSMNYFGIKWTTTKMYLYLCIYVLRKNPFMYMHIYPILGQDKIMFQWSYIFVSSTIRVLIISGQIIKPPHIWVISSVSLFFWNNISHFCTYIYAKPQTTTPWNVALF